MSQPLGKVTGDLDAPRGPDVAWRITVARETFGQPVVLHPPRNLHCALCSGGGCDRCERSGAVSLWKKNEPARNIRVTLPAIVGDGVDVCLRVPGEGGQANEPERGRGHLMLTVRLGDKNDEQVELVPGALAPDARTELMKRSVTMAVLLILLFLGLLKLSGWL